MKRKIIRECVIDKELSISIVTIKRDNEYEYYITADGFSIQYVFGAASDDFKKADFVRLYENGYFDQDIEDYLDGFENLSYYAELKRGAAK